MSTTTQCPHKLAASTISSIAASVVNNIVATTVGDPHAGHIGHHGQDKMMPADHSNHGTHDDMMMMYFHGGFEETILFNFWQTKSIIIFVISCIALFIAAALYEGIKLGRETLIRREIVKFSGSNAQSDENARSLLNNNNVDATTAAANADIIVDLKSNNRNSTNEATAISSRSRLLSKGHIIQTFLHMIQVAVSYLLMLVFMTYNSWLCLSVVLGAGLGYFFFGYKRLTTIDSNEHCH